MKLQFEWLSDNNVTCIEVHGTKKGSKYFQWFDIDEQELMFKKIKELIDSGFEITYNKKVTSH
jgi:hypothetical protein